MEGDEHTYGGGGGAGGEDEANRYFYEEGEDEEEGTAGSQGQGWDMSSLSSSSTPGGGGGGGRASVNQALMGATAHLSQEEMDKAKAHFKANPPPGYEFVAWPDKHEESTLVVRCGFIGKGKSDNKYYYFCVLTRACEANCKKGVRNLGVHIYMVFLPSLMHPSYLYTFIHILISMSTNHIHTPTETWRMLGRQP